MNDILKTEVVKPKFDYKFKFKIFVFEPIVAAIIGFLLFVTAIFLVKLLSYGLGFQSTIYFDNYDLFLSSLGLVLAFFIRLIDNIKKYN
ncbi:MAG: hypothetical protein V1773_18985 [bacterium]